MNELKNRKSNRLTDFDYSTSGAYFITICTKECGFAIRQKFFYDHIIRDDADYITKAEYIINNPAKWTEDKYYAEN